MIGTFDMAEVEPGKWGEVNAHAEAESEVSSWFIVMGTGEF